MKEQQLAAVFIAVGIIVCLEGAGCGVGNGNKKGDAPARTVLYYVDPMNPAHTSDKPGLAPCGMPMEAVYSDTVSPLRPGKPLMQPVPGSVKISTEKQQLIGVRVAAVERTSGTRTLRTLGRVAIDETRVFRVTVPVDGLVRTAGPIVSGSLVEKDEVLATFYNRDFLTAQQTYLYALGTMDQYKDNESDEQLKLTKAQMRAAEENLEFLGMGETQLREIARKRQIARSIELRSPVAGLVLLRNAFQGLRFDRGTELFRVAELDRVWVLADVFEKEAQYFQPGAIAQVALRTQTAGIQATVSRTLPQFDSVTRTLKVRLEAENTGYALRPEMFVDVELPVTLPDALVVPADAVLDSGLRKTVFVECADGVFEPRRVETGWRFGDQIQILGGLMQDEKIVISGNFLIDSESRMKLAAAGRHANPVKDPVCGMEVEEQVARAEKRLTELGGATYYFCSDACKRKLDSAPARFLETRAHEAAPPPEITASEPSREPVIEEPAKQADKPAYSFRRRRELRLPAPEPRPDAAMIPSRTVATNTAPARD